MRTPFISHTESDSSVLPTFEPDSIESPSGRDVESKTMHLLKSNSYCAENCCYNIAVPVQVMQLSGETCLAELGVTTIRQLNGCTKLAQQFHLLSRQLEMCQVSQACTVLG